MNRFNPWFSFIIPVLCFVLFFSTHTNRVSAQSADPNKTWHFQTDIYLIFPYMKGDIGIGNEITAPVDANPGDIFSKLKFGGMLYLEAHNNRWAITSDLIYMNLNLDIPEGEVWNSGSVSAKQMVWEPAGLYRILPFLEVGAGARLNNIQSGIEGRRNAFPAGTYEVNESMSKTWFDPILITRLTANVRNKLNFQFRGDLGGFGVGSDFTWQIQAYAGYRFTKLFRLTAGYRYMSMDYDKGTDKDRFIYNVATSGPELSFDFHF